MLDAACNLANRTSRQADLAGELANAYMIGKSVKENDFVIFLDRKAGVTLRLRIKPAFVDTPPLFFLLLPCYC